MLGIRRSPSTVGHKALYTSVSASLYSFNIQALHRALSCLRIGINWLELRDLNLGVGHSDIRSGRKNKSAWSSKFCHSSMADGVQEVCEGKANIILPKSVFYNPVQEFIRDLTISIISQFAEDRLREQAANLHGKQSETVTQEVQAELTDGAGSKVECNKEAEDGTACKRTKSVLAGVKCENGLRIFEGLAASGLRSIRFGLEIPGVKEIIANDFDKTAVEFIKKNISRNNLTDLVQSSCSDASMVMYQNKDLINRFDVIDLDPYGSASQFLDAAVQAVGDGGLLCITCTDAAVLCGIAGETCFAKYGSLSLHAKFCHEMALRILLHCVESHANHYSRYIVPLLSLSIDFYVRIYIRVHTSQKQVKMSVTKTGMVYHCVGCGSFALQPLATAMPTKGDNHKFIPGSGPPVGCKCEHCGHRHQIGGPIWIAPIHSVTFLDAMLNRIQRDSDLFGTSERMFGMLSLAREELPDVPLYYIMDELCSTLHCTLPNMLQMRSALLNAGYRVSHSHCAKNSYKTDAPPKAVWDILRSWVIEHPVNARRLTDGTAALAILQQPPVLQASFQLHPDANPLSRQKGLVRWQKNPEPYWGPKPRAQRGEEKERKILNPRNKLNIAQRKRNRDNEQDVISEVVGKQLKQESTEKSAF